MTPRDLYYALFTHFSLKTNEEAETIASQFTRAIEQALAHRYSKVDVSGFSAELAEIATKIPVTPASLSIPWQACRALQYGEPDQWAHTPILDTILATGPAEYGDAATVPWSKMQPYASSLLRYIADLIFTAERRLLIVAPYWSTEGIVNLKLARDGQSPPPPDITVMTSAEPTDPNRKGLRAFAEWMRSEGADVRVLVPTPLQNGTAPEVHAKVMLADGERGYLGSANISTNGLQRSIEAGVGLRGPAVHHLEKWYQNMWPFFEHMK